MKSTISYSEQPDFAVLRSGQHFVHLKTRCGDVTEDMLEFAEAVIPAIEKLKKTLSEKEFLCLRGIYEDDKHGGIVFYVDYIHHFKFKARHTDSEISSILEDGTKLDTSFSINVKIISVSTESDGFFPNSAQFYKPSPILR